VTIETESQLRETIWAVVHRTPVYDIHTHLYDTRFGDLLLWGIDELLTYHYLETEVFRYQPAAHEHFYAQMTYDQFFRLSKREQADIIWTKVFQENSPVSEAARGVLTTLGLLGLDPGSRDLEGYRAVFEGRHAREHIDKVFTVGNIEAVVMTNDPLDPREREVWEGEESGDARFKGALRLDGVLNDWKNGSKKLKGLGYDVRGRLDKESCLEVRRFLHEWCERMGALYMAVSLPPDFDPFDKSSRAKLIERCILPVCQERGIPFAMMIGVKKFVNPALGVARTRAGSSATSCRTSTRISGARAGASRSRRSNAMCTICSAGTSGGFWGSSHAHS